MLLHISARYYDILFTIQYFAPQEMINLPSLLFMHVAVIKSEVRISSGLSPVKLPKKKRMNKRGQLIRLQDLL